MSGDGPRQVPLANIQTKGTQMRALGLNQATVDDYQQSLDQILKDHPPVVYQDGESYWLADGHHTVAAAEADGRDQVPCEVRQGGQRHAILYACGANAEHGLRRTNADKRNAVQTLLECHDYTDGEIARTCRVTRPFVSKIRRELEDLHHRQVETVSTSTEGDSTIIGDPGNEGNGICPNCQGTEVDEGGACAACYEPDIATTGDGEEAVGGTEAAATEGVDIDGLAAPYKRAVNDLNRILRDMRAIIEDERIGVVLARKFNRIKLDLNNAKAAIAQAQPTCVCPKCDGSGCQACEDMGFWVKAEYQARKK